MFGKSNFLRNEAFERENSSLAFKIARRRRAIFLQSGHCGVSPLEGVAKNAEGGCSEGEASPTIIIFRKSRGPIDKQKF
jgi:hypothetical protein